MRNIIPECVWRRSAAKKGDAVAGNQGDVTARTTGHLGGGVLIFTYCCYSDAATSCRLTSPCVRVHGALLTCATGEKKIPRHDVSVAHNM